MNYKAWIPNVSGNLSFSNIKGTRIPSRAKYPTTINRIGDESSGLIYSLQERDLSDSPLPTKEGKFYYLLKAMIQNKWQENELLEGVVITFPVTETSKEDKQLLKSFTTKDFSQINADKLIENWAISSYGIVVDFKLCRDGVLDMEYEWKIYPGLINDELRSINYSILFESYSFLKDLIHAHKFHKYDDDAIVVPYAEEENPNEIWMVKTIRNLHKSIVFTYRNAKHHEDILHAIGKISYLESFQKVVKRRLNNKAREDFWIDTEQLRNSLNLKLQAQEMKESNNSDTQQLVLNVVFFVFAFVISMSQLLQIPCIKGLTYSKEDCTTQLGKEIIFSLDSSSLDYVDALLKYWTSITIGMPLALLVVLMLLNWSRIGRCINNNIGHYWWGSAIRYTMAYGLSGKGGKVIAYLWLGTLACLLFYLLLIALGLMTPSPHF